MACRRQKNGRLGIRICDWRSNMQIRRMLETRKRSLCGWKRRRKPLINNYRCVTRNIGKGLRNELVAVIDVERILLEC
jgi:hypothetical protein